MEKTNRHTQTRTDIIQIVRTDTITQQTNTIIV